MNVTDHKKFFLLGFFITLPVFFFMNFGVFGFLTLADHYHIKYGFPFTFYEARNNDLVIPFPEPGELVSGERYFYMSLVIDCLIAILVSFLIGRCYAYFVRKFSQ